MVVDRLEARQASVVVEGHFGPAEAAVLARLLAELPPGAGVRIDLLRARDLDDAALATLVGTLCRSCACVQLEGLSDHQRVLLRYLGMPLGPDGRFVATRG